MVALATCPRADNVDVKRLKALRRQHLRSVDASHASSLVSRITALEHRMARSNSADELGPEAFCMPGDADRQHVEGTLVLQERQKLLQLLMSGRYTSPHGMCATFVSLCQAMSLFLITICIIYFRRCCRRGRTQEASLHGSQAPSLPLCMTQSSSTFFDCCTSMSAIAP